MAASPVQFEGAFPSRRLGLAWIFLWCALALDVADESIHGFLIYVQPHRDCSSREAWLLAHAQFHV